ncbi:uncharacterized protein with PQ loop repeat [Lachnospiraceae bacterium PF1-22]
MYAQEMFVPEALTNIASVGFWIFLTGISMFLFSTVEIITVYIKKRSFDSRRMKWHMGTLIFASICLIVSIVIFFVCFMQVAKLNA